MLSSQQIIKNWDRFLDIIEGLPEERAEILLNFYNEHESRISMMPASERNWKNSAYAGGYIDNTLRVFNIIIDLNKIWEDHAAKQTFTYDEMLFVALHHNLGKMGTEEHEYYVPNDSTWHVNNLGMIYKFNDKVEAMKTNERSLFLLQDMGIKLSQEEYMAIKLCDGMYDDSNKFYFYAGQKETKIKSYLPYLLHHATVQAAQIEFQKWMYNEEDEKDIADDLADVAKKEKNIKAKPASKAYKTQKKGELQSVKDNPQLTQKTLSIIDNLFKED